MSHIPENISKDVKAEIEDRNRKDQLEKVKSRVEELIRTIENADKQIASLKRVKADAQVEIAKVDSLEQEAIDKILNGSVGTLTVDGNTIKFWGNAGVCGTHALAIQS